MTEKEFRKIVFETELPSSKKQEFLEKINNIENIISKDLPSYISFINLVKVGNLRNGLLLNNEKEIEINLLLDCNNKSKDIIILNSIHNLLLLNLSEEVKRNNNNLEIYYSDNTKLIIHLNEHNPKINICDILNNDYPLFKNTVRILKYFLKEQNIEVINDNILINLLGYSVQNHLVDYRYEGYIHAFSKGLDDFLKGSFIDLEEKTYHKYDLEKSYVNKSNYSIINFETGCNLTKDITPNDLNEYRKFKKEIQKLVSITDILVNNKELIIDVNPKINPQTKEYQWSYIVESLNISVSGGSYNQEQISQLDAIYKALQRALKVVIDKGLTKSSITIRCKYNFILKALDDEEIDLTSESKSRLKTILKFIEENKLKLTITK